MNAREKEIRQKALAKYLRIFVQPYPRYASKQHGGQWVTVKHKLGERQVVDHLKGVRSIATLGRYYPEFAVIDIDGREMSVVEKIRRNLGMNPGNSMLCASESPQHYHIIFVPIYAGKPPTVKLLSDCLGPVVRALRVELYPQKEKCVRLPFGPMQRCLDEGRELCDWIQMMYWFEKLEPYELGSINALPFMRMQRRKPREKKYVEYATNYSIYWEGRELLKEGLVYPHTRNDSQYKVLYSLWRDGYCSEKAIDICLSWIGEKHNRYSREVVKARSKRVTREVVAQARRIWSHYTPLAKKYGRVISSSKSKITYNDIIDILKICRARRSLSRFLFHLVMYAYPRRMQDEGFLCHSDKLKAFSGSSSYLDHLAALARLGVVKRASKYIVGSESKRITLNWKYRTKRKPIRIKSRRPKSIDDVLLHMSGKVDLVAIMKRHGLDTRDLERLKAWLSKLHAKQSQ